MRNRLLVAMLAGALITPTLLGAQTVRANQTRAIVRDAACPPATGWTARDTTWRTMTEATTAARTKLFCPAPPPPPPVDTTPTPPPPPPPPPPVSAWEPWCGGFNGCLFDGIRDVRIVQADGSSSVVRRVRGYPGLSCTGIRCDIGPAYTVRIANPRPGMTWGDSVDVPAADTGYSVALSAPSSYTGINVNGLGDFRTTCNLARVSFDDPVVYPNQPGASHAHQFYGNTAVSAFSTPTSIATSGGSTCRGGILNRSAYWSPVLYDSVTKKVITPSAATFYYKSTLNTTVGLVREMPAGLRMIAGDKANASTAQQPNIYWACGAYNPLSTIPDCAPGVNELIANVQFPQCWDGVNLDSPDHKAHMAYLPYTNPPGVSVCPASHPVMLPKIDEQFHFFIHAGDHPERWRLSSDMYPTTMRGGASLHADWVLGWDPATMRSLVTKCLQKGLDCGVGNIGGIDLIYP